MSLPRLTLILALDGTLQIEPPPSQLGRATAPLAIPQSEAGMQVILRVLRALRSTGPAKFGALDSSPTQSQITDWLRTHRATRPGETKTSQSLESLDL